MWQILWTDLPKHTYGWMKYKTEAKARDLLVRYNKQYPEDYATGLVVKRAVLV